MFRRIASTLVLAFSLAVPSLAFAAEAQDFMKDKHSQLTALVKQNQDKKLLELFDQVLDYDAIAKASLGSRWAELSGEEKAEFQKLLTGLVRQAYRKSLRKTADYQVKFMGEEPGPAGVMVKTAAQNRKDAREEPITIDYLMHQVGGKWRIADIVTEGTSLVGTNRNQFLRIIKKHGFPELLKRMRTKLEKGGEIE